MYESDKSRDRRRKKLIKRLAREQFIDYNTQTKIVKDKTIYCRKDKYPRDLVNN